ncbi:MAG TPA: tetratricopeptide repeat protein [Verrucomicrobiae bacterium]|jgi:tetratricopeptide (TPR) repeat protein|nr:tetratricopeptide repeat protein [Verrucomicrobiae bacterium]
MAQTFEVDGQQSQPAPNAQNSSKKKNQSAAQSNASGDNGIGWGSSIEVGRLARAAEDALKRGNPSAAADYAQRAVKAAPQDNKLWFLLGYTSRLAGHYQTSVEAYQHGLQFAPGNADGMSGLAQTYERMGRTDDAKKLLSEVIRANPKRTNDLLILGELDMRTGDTQQGITLLQRAEAQQPSAHAELMLAVAYLKLKQPDKAKQMLDLAKKHSPGNVEIFQAAANYYREEHDYKAAIATLKSAPKMTPAVLADLGYTYELDGDKEAAAQSYVRAANEKPREIGYQLSAAQAELRLGDTEKTREYLSRASAIDANHYRLHAIKALLAKEENRQADAIAEYKAAIAALPAGGVPEGQLYPIQLRLNLAELYRDSGDDQAAHQELATAEQEIDKLNVEGTAKAEFLRVRASLKMSDNDLQGAEADLLEARKLDPANDNITLQYANLLWKEGRKDESRKIYGEILAKDPDNRYALEAMGYLYREDNDAKMAAEYFNRLAKAYPDDYIPYLALGDLYTQTKQFQLADDNYQQAYKLAPENPLIIANAANAAIEAQQIKLAGVWVNRAKGKMNDDPRVMRERERYLFHEGNYAESAKLGYQVLQKLPKDRNASVYLAYDLYNMGRYDDALAVSDKYDTVLPNEANFPLLEGHVHKHSQLLDEAVNDYSRAVQRDPKMADAYINRGYTLNDMQNAQQASDDFNTALKLAPNNGVAHLGLAFSDLQLRHPKEAREQALEAQQLLGESGSTHLALATAYRQEHLLASAEQEYRAAIRYAPNDLSLQLALADTLYDMRRYQQSIDALNAALGLSPDDPLIYGRMAHAYAHLGRKDETMRYVEAAEKLGGDQSAILLDTGDALLTLGDQKGAMDRFARALEAPDANRVDARLAIARLMVKYGKDEDARQQISLAFAESRIGEAPPVTADNLIEAANLLLAMHDFDTADSYFRKAGEAGASPDIVAIGLANTYLAQGKTKQANEQLATIGSDPASNQNYDYLIAQSEVYRQRHQSWNALLSLSQADTLGGSEIAQLEGMQVASEEGVRVTDHLSMLTDFTTGGLYDDYTVYVLDQQIFGLSSKSPSLPPPRSQQESLWTTAYRYHFDNNFPMISGFFQIRNATGEESLPQEALIINRNTFDYNFNSAINPVVHLGDAWIALNTGLQFTLRRDTSAPQYENQNLFRQFLYANSSSFGNWLSFDASLYHEAGPFTATGYPLNSNDVGATLQFTVGRPWGNTSLITGYTRRDLTYSPLVRQFFTTSSYAGLQRKFMDRKLTASLLAEYIRAYRVQDTLWATAHVLRPAGIVQYNMTPAWSMNGQVAYEGASSFTQYDNVYGSFYITYMRPLHRSFSDHAGEYKIAYPLQFSVGLEAEQFPNFTGVEKSGTLIRPVFRLSIF